MNKFTDADKQFYATCLVAVMQINDFNDPDAAAEEAIKFGNALLVKLASTPLIKVINDKREIL